MSIAKLISIISQFLEDYFLTKTGNITELLHFDS